ncbi:MAG: MBL fold metallo-hydrolase [Clostridia bacterium]|nr:MBL fold metallo-hydrolase [Clostridia bacterium]
MNFVERVANASPEAGTLELFWLGQAGFLIKTSDAKTIVIDPYLSDCVERMFPENGLGFKRLSPAPMKPEDMAVDYLLISHEHGDHFDVDSMPGFMKNGKTRLYANRPVARAAREMGFDGVYALNKGEVVSLEGFSLLPVDCDHGELAPEAMGFILDFGFASIYYAGDTALTPERLRVPTELSPDVAILPINGAFGNLDGEQAAKYAGMLKSRIVIPCHFWTFPLHLGNPQQIIDAMPKFAPESKLELLCQGEGITIKGRQARRRP